MLFLHQLPVVASIASALIAKSASAEKVLTFTVNQVARKAFKHGPTAYLKSMRKWNGSAEKIADLTTKAILPGAVTAMPEGQDNIDLEYDCQVMIGNQTFNLNLDSGSSDLWVFGSSLQSDVGSGHTMYRPGSTAALQHGQTWSIQYGDLSSAQGIVYTDIVNIGGVSLHQAVEVADYVSEAFLSGTNDGLVGLAFDSLNEVTPNKATTFFSNAIKQGLPQALFTAKLKHQAPGCYTFGEIPEGEYVGSLAYTPVNNSDGQWMFTPRGYSVGKGSVVSASPTIMRGLADTGTSIILLETSIVEAYYSKVRGSHYNDEVGGYIFNCTAVLPDLSFLIGSYRAVVPGSFILYAPLDDGSGSCYGGLQDNEGVGFGVYGDVFLKSQFVVFDRTTVPPRLGFAPQA